MRTFDIVFLFSPLLSLSLSIYLLLFSLADYGVMEFEMQEFDKNATLKHKMVARKHLESGWTMAEPRFHPLRSTTMDIETMRVDKLVSKMKDIAAPSEGEQIDLSSITDAICRTVQQALSAISGLDDTEACRGVLSASRRLIEAGFRWVTASKAHYLNAQDPRVVAIYQKRDKDLMIVHRCVPSPCYCIWHSLRRFDTESLFQL